MFVALPETAGPRRAPLIREAPHLLASLLARVLDTLRKSLNLQFTISTNRTSTSPMMGISSPYATSPTWNGHSPSSPAFTPTVCFHHYLIILPLIIPTEPNI